MPLKMNIKRTLNFKLEQRKKNGIPVTDNVPIRMRLTFGGNRIEFTTGFRVDASKWDESEQKVKKSTTNRQRQTASEINAALANYVMVVQEMFKEYEVENRMPSVEEVKEDFTIRTSPHKIEKKKVQETVEDTQTSRIALDVYDEFVKEMGVKNNWSKASYTKFNSVKNHLQEFRAKATLDYYDEAGLTKYVKFLMETKQMRNSTIENQVDFIRMFLRWCHQKGFLANKDFEMFRPKLKSPQRKIIFLTPQELKQLRDVKIPPAKQYLERIRDVFLFMCFTGLRHSDTYNLRRSDIKEDHIEITTIKTTDSLIIDLNEHSRAILAKYEDVPFPNNKALPVISNQKMNDYVKELAKLAEINEPVRMTHFVGHTRVDEVFPKHELIGTHAGRRTFVCNALALGIPAHVVMKWTGHSDYKAMKPYIDIADSIRAKSMEKFNQLDALLS